MGTWVEGEGLNHKLILRSVMCVRECARIVWKIGSMVNCMA